MTRHNQRHLLLYIGLAALAGLSMYYLYRGISYRFLQEDRIGFSNV